MAPDFDLRLRTMASAIKDIILPVIPTGESMALEQAKLVLGSIEMLRGQIDYSHAYEITDAHGLIALVAKMQDLLQTRETDLRSAEEQINRPICSTADIRELNTQLRYAACRLLEASAGAEADTRVKVRRMVLDHEAAQIRRERAWVAKTGFDSHLEDVPGIPAILGLTPPHRPGAHRT